MSSIASGLTQLSSQPPPSQVTIQHMKKVILAEITDVTEEELNVMSHDEILSFYQELISADQDDDDQAPLAPSEAQTSKDGAVVIGQGKYQQPKYFSQLAYQLSNKRFEILCGDPVSSVNEKRQAIISAYNPAVVSTILEMKGQEILETYTRLRQPQKKQFYQLKQSVWPVETKVICMYVSREPKDAKFEEFTKRVKEERARNLERRNRKEREREQEREKRKEKQALSNDVKPHKSKSVQDDPFGNLNNDDQFFNENISIGGIETTTKKLLERGEKSELPKILTKPTENKKLATQKKDQIPPKPQIKQTEPQKKHKVCEAGVQTQNNESFEKHPKSLMTIISQVECFEETCSQSEEPQPEPKFRENVEEAVQKPSKMKYKDLMEAIMKPEKQPNQLVLEWLSQMKKTVQLLEEGYSRKFVENSQVAEN